MIEQSIVTITRRSFFATCLLVAISSGAKASSENHCAWPRGQSLVLSEIRRGVLSKEILVVAKCEKGVLNLNLGTRKILSVQWIGSAGVTLVSDGLDFGSRRKELIAAWHGPELALSAEDVVFRLTPASGSASPTESEKLFWPTPSLRAKAPLLIPETGKFRARRLGGHLHTGLDIPVAPGEKIYSPVDGQVVLIAHLKTQLSIFIKPSRGKETICIAHLRAPPVLVGQFVSHDSAIGRALNEKELAKTRHTYSHVHFELRKKIDDLGAASVDSYKGSRLERIFSNPWPKLARGTL